ncbi:MAG: ABC transporter ATP-binding protein [Dehalococcoidia bacterium]|nr:MAG: ABC transporter ATP-binding protein [Dehalococcoidia bacterium]
MIELHDVWRLYRMGGETINALAGIDLKVSEGEFVTIVGPSGSGKSTLLNIIGGLDTPTIGRIEVDGQDLSKASDRDLSLYRNKKVGFIFQTFNLQPTHTALENVSLPLVFAKVPLWRRKRIAREVMETVELSDRLRHKPNQLSGGERQRVAIARALVNDPKILLADEPTGNLDSKTGEQIMGLLTRLNKERGITLLLVTHDLKTADYADRMLRMLDGQVAESVDRRQVL